VSLSPSIPTNHHLRPIERSLYSASLADFCAATDEYVLGTITKGSAFAIEMTQRDAWVGQMGVLRGALARWAGAFGSSGRVHFEFVVPRVGKRIDAVVVLGGVVLVIEFKVGAEAVFGSAVDQVWDYALDLKNFHETSHRVLIAPILVATEAKVGGAAASGVYAVATTVHDDNLLRPICVGSEELGDAIAAVMSFAEGDTTPIDAAAWERGRYSPTPTIIEAAMALYAGHGVADISRSDAGATNLTQTSEAVTKIIREAKEKKVKAICFVTGVPGAGKTLVGLNVATSYMQDAQSSQIGQDAGEHAAKHGVFLSGNGPLVAILCEALARDKVRREAEAGRKFKKGQAKSEVKAFVQNVHHFRDECLADERPPIEHVVLFDEAQRAWNHEQTAGFMARKKGKPGFAFSEPHFLISCMDRHPDWAVVVCLVGGGQEINTGEAGIGEWVASIRRGFPDWHVHISPHLYDSEYQASEGLALLEQHAHVQRNPLLHLSVSMRSFRAENVSAFVKSLLDGDRDAAIKHHASIREKYPIVLTRDLSKAKAWLRERARGSERHGMVVSSQAQRLKPHAIDVRVATDPVHWFLNDKDDTRSSYYLEDVATEFDVQGLELDWACVVWDGDFRHAGDGANRWEHCSFVGSKWHRINKAERQTYLKNAYRVLLTRARQGMVICVPEGDATDPTRDPAIYDGTYQYLRGLGLSVI
jgi:hypothetical protein